LVEETGENHRLTASHWQTLSHNVVSSTPLPDYIRGGTTSNKYWSPSKSSKLCKSLQMTKVNTIYKFHVLVFDRGNMSHDIKFSLCFDTKQATIVQYASHI
jgi:hypothetical protein